jgi:hypothetical protein
MKGATPPNDVLARTPASPPSWLSAKRASSLKSSPSGGSAGCSTHEDGRLQLVVEGADEEAMNDVVGCLKEFRFIANVELRQ